MAPGEPTDVPEDVSYIRGGNLKAWTRCVKPIVNTGSLDNYKHQDLTPIIGREFEGLQVTDLLQGHDQIVKDLAITISQRGVVFLRDQDVTPTQMKALMEKLTEVAGCVCLIRGSHA